MPKFLITTADYYVQEIEADSYEDAEREAEDSDHKGEYHGTRVEDIEEIV